MESIDHTKIIFIWSIRGGQPLELQWLQVTKINFRLYHGILMFSFLDTPATYNVHCMQNIEN